MTVNEALIRKELREHRQLLILLSGFVSGVTLLSLPFGPSCVLDVYYLFVALYYSALAGLFVATRIAIGERNAGTMDFVRALPVSLTTFARIRLFIGGLVCAAPIVLATTLVAVTVLCTGNSAVPGDRMANGVMHGQMQSLNTGPFGAVIYTGILSTVSTLLVFIWSCVASVGRQNEARAGVASVCALIFWLIATMGTIVGLQRVKVFDWLGCLLIAVVTGCGPGVGLGLSEITFNHNRGIGLIVFSHIVVMLIQANILRILVNRFCNGY
jgi:ABC-type transport system involved in multi-copper enzyme maturation permease subunit